MVNKAVWTSSARAKLARADIHLGLLYELIDLWSDEQPYSIRRESNADGSEHTFYLQLTGRRPPVWDWAVVLGDALHNLRGALDHLVYGLAVAHGGTHPPVNEGSLAFPITTDRDKFDAARKRRLHALPADVQAAVERTQPYNRTHKSGWQPLWWLSQMNDIDKHRLAVLSPIAGHPDRLEIGAEPGTFQALWNSGTYEDGTPILRVILTRPDPNVFVNLDLTGAVVIKAEGQRPIGVVPCMSSIRREVAVVIRYLSLYF